MTNTNGTIEVLNDLVQINNDRIAGYQKAIEESKTTDMDLKAIFQNFISESKDYKSELSEKITSYGGVVDTGTTVSGKIYRAWMDTKNAFTGGGDRTAILSSCEFGEDAAQKAYQMALTTDNNVDQDAMKLIAEQKESLKKSHDLIKKYRDANEVIEKG